MNEKQAEKLIKAQSDANKLLASVDAKLGQLVKQTDPKKQPDRVLVEQPQPQRRFVGRGM